MSFTTASTPHEQRADFSDNKKLWVYLGLFGILWIYTLVGTPDLYNWLIENALTIAFLAFIFLTRKRFRFSDISYTFMFVYLCLHVYGSMYTYAENPFGYWLQDQMGSGRNHYDRIVHFSFGLMLAYPMRDAFREGFQWFRWICWILPVEITLSFSGLYELLEYAVADLLFPEQGPAYLGTQGDIWDAQKDMGLAFSGACIIMLLAFSLKRIFPGRSKR